MNNNNFIQKIVETAHNYPEKTFSESSKVYTCVNPFSYHLVRQNPDLFECIDGVFVDGMIMCWFIRLLWGKKIPRLSFDMVGMAIDLFSYLNNEGRHKNIYFLGTHQDLLEKSIQNFKMSYPNIHIAGYRNGYFADSTERKRAIDTIINTNSDFVIVGLGSPMQEQFALDLKKTGYEGIVFTCGGFLHQSARRTDYYPYWVNKLNLRAFYRLFREKGLWKRLYNVLIEFPIKFSWDTMLTKLKVDR